MKKTLALILAFVMMLSLCACGGSQNSPPPADVQESTPPEDTVPDTAGTEPAGDEGEEELTGETENDAAAGEPNAADGISDTMTSEDGNYEVAFVTDGGQLKDGAFNQGAYNGVKLFAADNGLSYKYYQPANGDRATDDDRYDSIKEAAEAGAKVIVCVGGLQSAALETAAYEFPDVNFIFIDGWNMGLDNVAGITFQEEQCGYFAGYAIVREGYTRLGFCGGDGGMNPAYCRYGYGFVQGANAAAAEMGVDVEINYSWQYAASSAASDELESMISDWYAGGTEIVFASGGEMFRSVTAAASANDGLVIGMDTDRSSSFDTVITSAVKDLQEAAIWALTKALSGSWSEIGGALSILGAAEGATGLPTATWSMKTYTVGEYEKLLADVVAGNLQIDSTVLEGDAIASEKFSNVTVNYI